MDPTARFGNRVENYVKYRPGYPEDVVSLLEREAGLTSSSVIADIGSGTGKLSELLLGRGHRVIGVEPNDEMRAAAERLFASEPRFTSIAGRAEATSLPDESVDCITAGQAFHWFDVAKARAEFLRILRPEGLVALIWNDRRLDATPFLRAYEDLLVRRCRGYPVSEYAGDTASIERFFGGAPTQRVSFESRQRFDYEGLLGRLLSSSYAPLESEGAAHQTLVTELRRIFDEHAEDGVVYFYYDTIVIYGKLRA